MLQEKIANQSFKPLDLSSIRGVATLITGIAIVILAAGVIYGGVSLARNYFRNRNKINGVDIDYQAP